jgi:hypothetical protein
MPPVLSDVQKATKLSILLVKRDVLPPILEELNRKFQELETKIEVQRVEIETLKDRLSKNESMLPKKQD